MKKYLALAAALLLTTAPAGAAVQIVQNGLLTGATGVTVDGSTYDVEFLDGTCASVFSGCDSVSDFAFTTQASGLLAAQALLDQVFIDGAMGQFDTNTALTRGCPDTSTPICVALIPTNFAFLGNYIEGSRAGNNTVNAFDDVGLFGVPVATFNTFDGPNAANLTFARFTLSSVTGSVPEPATWGMMLMGFGAMGVSLRRRRRTHDTIKLHNVRL